MKVAPLRLPQAVVRVHTLFKHNTSYNLYPNSGASATSFRSEISGGVAFVSREPSA